MYIMLFSLGDGTCHIAIHRVSYVNAGNPAFPPQDFRGIFHKDGNLIYIETNSKYVILLEYFN